MKNIAYGVIGIQILSLLVQIYFAFIDFAAWISHIAMMFNVSVCVFYFLLNKSIDSIDRA